MRLVVCFVLNVCCVPWPSPGSWLTGMHVVVVVVFVVVVVVVVVVVGVVVDVVVVVHHA